jgi:hypothetical protein
MDPSLIYSNCVPPQNHKQNQKLAFSTTFNGTKKIPHYKKKIDLSREIDDPVEITN